MTEDCDIAVVGAGPYGLSIAAHLNGAGADFRLFGAPMQTWRSHMPDGMLLKSDGFASSLSAPGAGFTLADHCRDRGLSYADTAEPVPLPVFNDYAMTFQRRFAPMLEERDLVGLDRDGDGFVLTFADGATARARRVVLAIGVTPFAHLPSALTALPEDLVSHSIAPRCLVDFAGRDVAVIGGGASAVDTAAALHEAGANTTLVARRHDIRFCSPPPAGRRRSAWQRVRHPRSGLGPGLRSRIYSDLPDAFRLLPADARHTLVGRHLGPASLWQMRSRITGKVDVLTGHGLRHAEADGGRVRLTVEDDAGTASRIEADHVVAATGFRVDVARLSFLNPRLAAEIRVIDGAPELDAAFQTSARGLHVTGAAAATSFGPLMRFMYGAGFAARRLQRRLA